MVKNIVFGHYPSSYIFFYLRQRFGDWILPPSSSKRPTQLGPVDRASPHLRTPAPTQDRIYNPSTTYPCVRLGTECWFRISVLDTSVSSDHKTFRQTL
jgi:hypothetical protein